MVAIVSYASAPFNGPFAMQGHLLSAIAAGPYEGPWVPVMFAKQASLEVLGVFSVLDAGLWGTNALDPLNTYQVTIGGTAHSGDQLQLTFTNDLLPNGQEIVQYSLTGGDTLNSAAAALAAAVQADTRLAPLGFTASAVGAVVTITWPSVSPNAQAPETPSSPPAVSATALAQVVNGGGATTTLAIALGTDGTLLNAISSLGLVSTPSAPYCRWMKARLNSITGTSVTARIAGCA